MERGNRRLQYLIVSAVSSSAVTAGVSFSWATPVLPKIADNEFGFPMNNEEISWMVAITSLGFVIGSCAARITSDRCGRRITILGSSLPCFVGTIFMIFAWEAWMLSCGRFLWGIGTGMLVGVSMLYIGEIADKEIRGSLSLSNRFMISFGCLLVIAVGAFVSYKTLSYIMLALPVIFFAMCWWIPESPYYLLKEGKVDAARQTLQMLTGVRDENVRFTMKLDSSAQINGHTEGLDDVSALHIRLKESFGRETMQSNIRIEMSRSDTVKEFLTGKRYRKAIFIVAGMKVPQIMSGIRVIQIYLGPILTESKSGMNITTALIVFGAVRFVLGVISSVLVDRVGRRPLLISSFFGTGVLLTIVAIYFGVYDNIHGTSYPYSLIPFVSIIFAIIISVLGYESVAYLVPAELFPMNVKAIATSVVSVSGGVVNFISIKSYQQIKDSIGLSGVFVVYALASFIGAVCCYCLVPETKGKSLKEIQVELNGNIYDEEEKLNTVAVAVNDKEGKKTENRSA